VGGEAGGWYYLPFRHEETFQGPPASTEEYLNRINLSRVNDISQRFTSTLEQLEDSADWWEDVKAASSNKRRRIPFEFHQERGIEMEGYYWDVVVEAGFDKIRIVLPNDGIFYENLTILERERDNLFVAHGETHHNREHWVQFTKDQMDFFTEITKLMNVFYKNIIPGTINIDDIDNKGNDCYYGLHHVDDRRMDFILDIYQQFVLTISFEPKYPNVSKTVVDRKMRRRKPAGEVLPSHIKEDTAKPILDPKGVSLFFGSSMTP